ncbi:10664_t:CDS:2 [Dentiscutata heterogama]|uniref:10664_t:CDS:1 n=1 Tax=Dentiscutata heterogama TaxID=1316150 RepID=A0ACA9JZQ4_9GLOM|nr:10664_t:CDS:2 [Dentiscutata heterogama]
MDIDSSDFVINQENDNKTCEYQENESTTSTHSDEDEDEDKKDWCLNIKATSIIA